MRANRDQNEHETGGTQCHKNYDSNASVSRWERGLMVKKERAMPRGRKKKGSGELLFKSAELIGWALGGLEREIAQTRERLAALNAQAARLRARAGLGSGRASGDTATPEGGTRRGRRRRGMTAEGRKRISEMMKKRWAEAKKKNKNRL
jgi:hypothetical protein